MEAVLPSLSLVLSPPLPSSYQRPSLISSPTFARQVADFLGRVLKLAGLRLSDLVDRLACAPLDRGLLLAQV